MPTKSQRAASRHARLSRRRRKGKAAPQNFQAGPVQSAAAGESAAQSATRPASQAAAVARATAAPSSARAASRPRRRAADVGVSNVQRYLGRELRQIGVITSLIVVILAGLTFVLG